MLPETKFRNQNLNSSRFFSEKRVHKGYIGNDLPRFCVKISSINGKFKIVFNDAFKTAQSSLVSQAIYQFRLLSYSYLKDKHSNNGTYRIKIKNEILSRRLYDLNEIDNIRLKEGNYLIEVI